MATEKHGSQVFAVGNVDRMRKEATILSDPHAIRMFCRTTWKPSHNSVIFYLN